MVAAPLLQCLASRRTRRAVRRGGWPLRAHRAADPHAPPARRSRRRPARRGRRSLAQEGATPLEIDRLDHLVLTVRDIAATIAFYTRVLGMEEVTFGEGSKVRKALRFGRQK